MTSGFDFKLYDSLFTNCFVHSTNYSNGDLQLSLFGVDPETNQTAHFADISLEQNRQILAEDEIVVDCKFKPTLIPQLINLGILKRQTGICTLNGCLYPVYTIDETMVKNKKNCMQELVAA